MANVIAVSKYFHDLVTGLSELGSLSDDSIVLTARLRAAIHTVNYCDLQELSLKFTLLDNHLSWT